MTNVEVLKRMLGSEVESDVLEAIGNVVSVVKPGVNVKEVDTRDKVIVIKFEDPILTSYIRTVSDIGVIGFTVYDGRGLIDVNWKSKDVEVSGMYKEDMAKVVKMKIGGKNEG